MEFRQLGSSDLQVPVVSFGAWAIGGWMWGGTDDAAAVRAIQQAIDAGITCIDTAAIYGMGHSERIVGQAIAGRREKVIIATKCGLRWDLDIDKDGWHTEKPDGTPVKVIRYLKADSIRYEVEQSLKRLNIDEIDLYQCHWPDPETPIQETMEALADLQRQGKIRAIGVSNFTVDMIRECLQHTTIASDQPLYNPLERDIEDGVLPFCVENNVGILAYSPIAQGLMTGKVTMDREFPEGDHRAQKPWFKPANRKRVLDMLEKVRPIAQDHGATLAQLTINWIISQEGITSALVGARTPEQAVENAKAAEFKLSETELATIRGHIEALGTPE